MLNIKKAKKLIKNSKDLSDEEILAIIGNIHGLAELALEDYVKKINNKYANSTQQESN